MRYFNGFSLEGESELFAPYLVEGDLTVAGFSYGAQEAFEYVYESRQRVQRLILLSPAFFQTQKPSFTRTQLRYFKADKASYVKQFLSNVSTPSQTRLEKYLKVGTQDELEALLSYQWDEKRVKEVLKRGTTIEVFLGSEDKIINSKTAFEFFSSLTTTYFIKGAGHLLKAKND